MEKEFLHIDTGSVRSYRRVTADGEVHAEPVLILPEDNIVRRFEDSLSDFLTPGLLFKRSFDIVVSLVVLLASLPLMGLIALAIRAGTRGPAFHNVFRTGMGFRVFKVYAFRTTRAGTQRMAENLSHIRSAFGAADVPVPSLTPLGRILRSTGLDMLPMFLNVLLGDLSLVGNRALPLQDASRLVDDHTAVRFVVPAGIWGPLGRNELRTSATQEAVILVEELTYAHKRSFMTDLRILAGIFRKREALDREAALARIGDIYKTAQIGR